MLQANDLLQEEVCEWHFRRHTNLFVALATVNCLHNLGRCRLGGLLHEHAKGTIGRKCVAEVGVTVVCFFSLIDVGHLDLGRRKVGAS